MTLIGHLVGVVWKDAFADATAQMSREEINAARSYIFTSYGILVRDDRGRDDIEDPLIAVSHERGEDGIFRGVTFIPAKMLIEIQDLGSGKPKGQRTARRAKKTPLVELSPVAPGKQEPSLD